MEQFENFAKMSSSSDVCPCNLCERFIPNVEYNLYDGNFFKILVDIYQLANYCDSY